MDRDHNGVQDTPLHFATLKLTMTMEDHTLQVDGVIPNIDTALAMLAQAQRHFEAQLKLQEAISLRQKIADHEHDKQISAMVRNHK